MHLSEQQTYSYFPPHRQSQHRISATTPGCPHSADSNSDSLRSEQRRPESVAFPAVRCAVGVRPRCGCAARYAVNKQKSSQITISPSGSSLYLWMTRSIPKTNLGQFLVLELQHLNVQFLKRRNGSNQMRFELHLLDRRLTDSAGATLLNATLRHGWDIPK